MAILSRLLWLFLALYLIAGVVAIGVALTDDGEFRALYLVVLAMPWTLLVDPVLGALGLRTEGLSYGFLGAGILANAYAVLWAARFLGRL